MKISQLVLLSLLSFQLASQLSFGQQQYDQHYFQLKVYHFEDAEQQELTDQYLESAYLPALHRANIEEVGVFKPHQSDTASSRKTYVLVTYPTLQEFASIDNTLKNDSQYLSDGKPYLEAPHDRPPYQRIQTFLLKAFKDAPTLLSSELKGPKDERVYELRSYESPSEALNRNKVDMFNAGGEIELFNRLNFNAIFYGNVITGDQMPNLMYMTSFKDIESRDEHWNTFREDAEWGELSSMDKYQNNVSKADIFLLSATSYSDI